MPAERTLPTAAAHREFTVLVGGQALPREHQLLAASIQHHANHIGSARLVYADGAASSGDFALSASDTFKPGAELEVHAGAGGSATLLFKGLVVSQRLKVRDASAAQLVVECRHAAVRLSLRRNSKSWFDSTDGDVITELLGGHAGTVAATAVSHEQLVQHDLSDWDFIVTRARANGQWVFTRDGSVHTAAPALTGSALATLQFGATLLEFEAEAQARGQMAASQSISWSADDQALSEQDGASPTFRPPGNLSSDDAASALGQDQAAAHHAGLADSEAAAWASARWQHSRVDFISGRAKCEGFAPVQPGDVLELAGVGARFSGKVLCTGVRHDLDPAQGWKVHLQFGGLQPDPALQQRLQAQRVSLLVAPVSGLQIGVVTDNEDPQGNFRVRVKLPLVADDEGVWARVGCLDAGNDRGLLIRPEIGDEVVLGFLDADPRAPVLLGMLHSSAKAAPLTPSNDNHQKGFISRSGMKWLFDDDKKVLTLSTPAGNSVVLSEDDKAITLKDQHGNSIKLDAEGITLDSTKAVTLKAGTECAFEATSSFAIKAANLKLEASASAELKGGATATLKGGVVQIN